MIVPMPCTGQEHMSPTQATGMPSTVEWVAVTLVTDPPRNRKVLRTAMLGMIGPG